MKTIRDTKLYEELEGRMLSRLKIKKGGILETKKGNWTEEEKKEYFEKFYLLQNKIKEILNKQCDLYDLLKNGFLDNNFVESIQKYSKLQKGIGLICNEKEKLDNEFGIYY